MVNTKATEAEARRSVKTWLDSYPSSSDRAFFGVDCKADHTRLRGLRWDGTNASLKEALARAVRKMSIVPREDWKKQMLDTVLAAQVKAGGVDTEGSRAQAERWLAMVCACVCSGLRATTLRSRFHDTRSDVLGWEEHLDVRNPSPRLGVP